MSSLTCRPTVALCDITKDCNHLFSSEWSEQKKNRTDSDYSFSLFALRQPFPFDAVETTEWNAPPPSAGIPLAWVSVRMHERAAALK